jgi:hypothetical protein
VPPRAPRRRAARSPPTAARSSQEHRRPDADVRRFCCFRPPRRPIVRRRQQEDTTTAARRPRWLVPPPEELHCAEPVPAAVTVICSKSVRPRLLLKKSLRPSCPSFVARSSMSPVEHRTHPAVRQDKQAPQGISDMEAQPHSCVTGSILSPLCCYLAGTRASAGAFSANEHHHRAYRTGCRRPPPWPGPANSSTPRRLLPAVSLLPCSGKDRCYCGCSPGLN